MLFIPAGGLGARAKGERRQRAGAEQSCCRTESPEEDSGSKSEKSTPSNHQSHPSEDIAAVSQLLRTRTPFGSTFSLSQRMFTSWDLIVVVVSSSPVGASFAA